MAFVSWGNDCCAATDIEPACNEGYVVHCNTAYMPTSEDEICAPCPHWDKPNFRCIAESCSDVY